MVNDVIGSSHCPMCVLGRVMEANGGPVSLNELRIQEVRVSDKSKKPYINCDECGAQSFARMPGSVHTLKTAAEYPWGGKQSEKPAPVTAAPLVASPAPVAKKRDTIDDFMFGRGA